MYAVTLQVVSLFLLQPDPHRDGYTVHRMSELGWQGHNESWLVEAFLGTATFLFENRYFWPSAFRAQSRTVALGAICPQCRRPLE